MKAKRKKKLYITIALALFGAGVLCLIFMDKLSSLGFLGFELIGASLILFGKYASLNYKLNLIELDKKLKNKLKDSENSINALPYNEVIDENYRLQTLNNYIKKKKKNYIAFYILAVMFIFVGIFLLFS